MRQRETILLSFKHFVINIEPINNQHLLLFNKSASIVGRKIFSFSREVFFFILHPYYIAFMRFWTKSFQTKRDDDSIPNIFQQLQH